MSERKDGIAVYTGTFDPVHHGHVDVIKRGSRLFAELVVGVGVNPDKSPFFDLEERVDLLRRVIAMDGLANVRVAGFEGLAVSFVRQLGARVMLRGLRTTSDMEAEFTMALMNSNLAPEIETVFLMSKEPYSHLSSTLLRQIASFGGNLETLLPAPVAAALAERVRQRKG